MGDEERSQKMKKIIVLVFICCNMFVFGANKENYKTYTNTRFGYSVAVPYNTLIQESESGDGTIIMDKDGIQILVYGTFHISSYQIREGMDASEEILKLHYYNLIEEHSENLGYHILKNDYCIVSYREQGMISYQKIMLNKRNRSYAILSFSYPEKEQKKMQGMLETMVKSMKVNLSSVYEG